MKTLKHLLLIAFAIPFFTSCGYNTMVEKSEMVDASWAQVENVYQRRADLIPNLVNTVKGYAAHEQETLTGVIEARSKATSVNINADNLNEATLAQFQQAQDGLTSALSKLMVVMERYPDLKANQNFMDLQAQLEGTENRIAVERKKFNDATRDYNAYIKKFPRVIYASWFDFEKKPYFKAEAGSEKAPKVEF
ncbi:LemA family protein [Carboxylicivirga mesophila]|uniref:LemA family protein n=1 Tax=Carboxylicivirga mesophila TaxID=1166478 RepID=A0ABS5KFZ1_9BACT|nr:LemA family protein [Carboxylicivirga mesophila]MBS2213243.1 LemA family protein [Carboxylicivirga mesophila]